jgi:hypothetical protein
MKKHYIIALVAVGLLATLNSCSKDESIEKITKQDTAPWYNPLDPEGYGYYDIGNGELYYYKDSVTSFDVVNEHYLKMTPLKLDKYKNGDLLDSVCNKDLALRFEVKARKTYNKEVKWGIKPKVVDEFTPTITFTMGNTMTIRFSKMVSAFGFEFNSLFKDGEYGITTTYRNTKLNKVIPPTYTSYIRQDNIGNPTLGMTSGAWIRAIESQTPFNEVTIQFGTGYKAPTLKPPYDISFGGFRYKIAK